MSTTRTWTEAELMALRSLTDVRAVGIDADLDGEDVLPGFRCPLADVLGSREDG